MGLGRTRAEVVGLVVAAALALTVAGCASSDPAPTAEASTSTSTSTTAAPPTTQDEAADEALAADALLTVDEVPGGPWIEGDPRADSPGTGLDCEAMAEESEYFEENARGAPGAKAPELTDDATGAQLQLDIELVADDEVGATIAGYFADERFAGCLEERLAEETDTGSATITGIVVEPLETGSYGDSSSAWSVTFTISEGAQSAEVEGVIGFVQVGRGFANVSLVGDQPVGAADVDPIMEAAADKLESTLG